MKCLGLYFSAYIFIGLSCCAGLSVHAQDQRIADSIKLLLRTETAVDSIYLERLARVAQDETNPAVSKQYAEKLISLAERDSLYNFLISGYLQKGNAEKLQGNLAAALESYFKSISYAKGIKDLKAEGKLNTSIADVYSSTGGEEKAIPYYTKAISLLRQVGDPISLAGTLLNAGENYFYLRK